MNKISKYGLATLAGLVLTYTGIKMHDSAVAELIGRYPTEIKYSIQMTNVHVAQNEYRTWSRDFWSAWIGPNGETPDYDLYEDLNEISRDKYADLIGKVKYEEQRADSIRNSHEYLDAKKQRTNAENQKDNGTLLSHFGALITGATVASYASRRKQK